MLKDRSAAVVVEHCLLPEILRTLAYRTRHHLLNLENERNSQSKPRSTVIFNTFHIIRTNMINEHANFLV